MNPYVLVGLSIALGAVGQVLMKWGTGQVALSGHEGVLEVLLRYLTSLPVLAGLGCYGLSAVLWILAIARVELSIAYPMVALSYVLVFALSVWLFGETISGLRIGGLALILVGVVLIAKS
jgi:multidrug transporter EmrE-like cation transporter